MSQRMVRRSLVQECTDTNTREKTEKIVSETGGFEMLEYRTVEEDFVYRYIVV